LILAAAWALYSWSPFEPFRQETGCIQNPSLAGHRMQIKGLKFSDQLQGRKTLNIQADEFTVEKMKVAHFRLSLFNVAKLKNTVIDIFGEPTNLTENPAADIPGPLHPPGVSFQGVFDRDALTSLGVQRISYIKAAPVKVNLFSRDMLLTSISGSSALFNLNNGGIGFNGDVRMVSGSREIQAESVIFFPGENAFEIRGPYRLNSRPDMTSNGKGLKCDLFLQALQPGPGHHVDSLEQKDDNVRWMRQTTFLQEESNLPPKP